MSNHYHLILSTPFANMSAIMAYFNREVAKAANKKSQRINHFFGRRYDWSLIQTERYYWNAVKYVFRNPVEAGICMSVGDYQFSSLNCPVDENFWSLTKIISNSRESYLDWFDHKFQENQKMAVQKALRRREFKLPKNKDGYLCELDIVRPEKVAAT